MPIPGEGTAFREELVAAVIEDLGTGDRHFRIIGLDRLEEQDTRLYGAILLVTGYRSGRLGGRVTAFLEEDPTNPTVVVFYTRGTEDPTPERSKLDLQVDAVSSASRDDRAERRAQELATLLKQRF